MVATLVRLKLRLLRNGLRSTHAKVAVTVFSMVGMLGLAMLFTGALVLRRELDFVAPWITIAFAVVLLLWMVVPLLVGMTDGAIDPSRLAHLPVGGPRLVIGLVAAAAAGLVPTFCFAALMLLSLVARTQAEFAYAVIAGLTLLLMCVTTAQVAATSMSGMLRGRKTRDIAAAILAVLAMSAGLFMQFGFDAIVQATLPQLQNVARWLRWTPGGWVGQGVAWSRDGRWAFAIGALAAGLTYVALFAFLWWKLLQRLLTGSEERGGSEPSVSNFIPGLVARLPGGPPVHAATARALRSIRRDPREWSGIASQLPLLLILGFPVARIDSDQVVLFAGAAGVYAGMLNSNLFGIDGRSIWIDQVSAPSMRPVLWGKTIAHAIVVLPILAAIVVGLATWKGGWAYAPQGIALAFATFGAISGAVAIASVKYALPLPDGVNPFAGQGTGQSASQGFLLMGSLFVGIVLAIPATTVLVGASLYRAWLGIILSPLGFAYGWWMWRRGIQSASRQADERGPELLVKLSVRG